MVSVLPPSALLPVGSRQPELQLNELDSLRDAVEPFTELIVRSGRRSLRLHCTIPTWSPSSDTCFDLHDLYDLRSRFLLFIHAVMESLRHSGVSASYTLSPSNSLLCLVYALPPELSPSEIKSTTIGVLENTEYHKRETVIIADLQHGPALIVT